MTENNLAARLRRILNETNTKQRNFAKECGISENYVSLLVNGRKKTISETLALLIEQNYGYSADWLITGTGIPFDNLLSLRCQIKKDLTSMDEDDLKQVSEFIQSLACADNAL